jgi:hypothetical protein
MTLAVIFVLLMLAIQSGATVYFVWYAWEVLWRKRPRLTFLGATALVFVRLNAGEAAAKRRRDEMLQRRRFITMSAWWGLAASPFTSYMTLLLLRQLIALT